MKNESLNITNFKLRIFSSIFGKGIKDVTRSPKEYIHKLVCICMNNTARNLCAYCALFYKKLEYDKI